MRHIIRSLEEDLAAAGLIDAGETISSVSEGLVDSEGDSWPEEGTPEFEGLPLAEQVRIRVIRKRKRRRPKQRRTAAEKAKQRRAAKKRRRSATGKKMAKLRSKAMKKARRAGLVKPGKSVSIRLADTGDTANISEGKNMDSVVSLIESMESVAKALSLDDEGLELKSAFENALELCDLTIQRFEKVLPDLAKSARLEAEQLIAGLQELHNLAKHGLGFVLEGKAEIKAKDGGAICLDDVIEDIVEELEEYVNLIPEFEEET